MRSAGRGVVRKDLDAVAQWLDEGVGILEHLAGEACQMLMPLLGRHRGFPEPQGLTARLRVLAAEIRAADISGLAERTRRVGPYQYTIELNCVRAFRHITSQDLGFTRASESGEMRGTFHDLVAAVFAAMGIKGRADTAVRRIYQAENTPGKTSCE